VPTGLTTVALSFHPSGSLSGSADARPSAGLRVAVSAKIARSDRQLPVSGGRFLFGIGGGWNQDEIESHGTEFKSRFKKMCEQIEAMKEIWTQAEPEYHGDIVEIVKMRTWPKPVQKPHPPVIVGGAWPHSARRAIRYGDGWVPNASRAHYADVTEFLPQFRQMASAAGRDPDTLEVTVFGASEDRDRLLRWRDRGVARVVVMLPSDKAATVLPILDRWAGLIRQTAQ
jgi:hypothetical protein